MITIYNDVGAKLSSLDTLPWTGNPGDVLYAHAFSGLEYAVVGDIYKGSSFHTAFLLLGPSRTRVTESHHRTVVALHPFGPEQYRIGAVTQAAGALGFATLISRDWWIHQFASAVTPLQASVATVSGAAEKVAEAQVEGYFGKPGVETFDQMIARKRDAMLREIWSRD